MTDIQHWEDRRLTDLAEYINGYAFKPEDLGEEGLPIIRIEQLKNPDSISDFYSGKLDTKNIIQDGDLIFSWSASLFLRIWQHGQAALNQHLFKVVENENVDRIFLKQFIEYNLPEITKASHGSTMQHITRKELDRFKALFPVNKPEQSKIAEVLSKVEQAIEQTESLIAKQQRIKTGLMQDLLTRGIDEHGNLRSEETHEFKDSHLGRIPKGWRDDKLGKTLLQIKRGPSLSTNNEMRGIIYLTSDNISDSGELIWPIIKYVDLRSSNLNSILDIGDVILNCVNSEAQIGKVGFVDKLIGITTTGFNNFALSFNADMILPKFAFYFLSYSTFQRGLRKKIKPAINQSSFSASDLDDLPIVIPQIEEQILIIAKLDEISKAAHRLQKSHSKLNRIKTALMQDLLTGKVRVTPLLENM